MDETVDSTSEPRLRFLTNARAHTTLVSPLTGVSHSVSVPVDGAQRRRHCTKAPRKAVASPWSTLNFNLCLVPRGNPRSQGQPEARSGSA